MDIPANKVHEVLSKHILVDGFPQVFDFAKSEGSWLADQATGKKYLDRLLCNLVERNP